MNLKLVVDSKANSHPLELLLNDSSHSIGRMHDNDLSIQDDCVSGYHAKIFQTPEGDYTVNDLNSSNGTFLNGTRISSPERMQAGDVLKIGNFEVAVREYIKNVTEPENDSDTEEPRLKIISLKDYFSVSEEKDHYTYPIAPLGTPPPLGNTEEVLKETVRAEEPVPESGEVSENEEAECAGEAEPAKAELPKKPVETSDVDLRSQIEILTADLDDALKEISHLKAVKAPQIPMPDKSEGEAAEAAKLKQEIVQSHADSTALRSEIIKVKDQLAESEGEAAEAAKLKQEIVQ
ncbi:MAG: FHA domain-containing protein, partial [Verrucomicrobiales bacterium]|nr:FHA domain-containing protein [Verrucomicrobiales bacterium]